MLRRSTYFLFVFVLLLVGQVFFVAQGRGADPAPDWYQGQIAKNLSDLVSKSLPCTLEQTIQQNYMDCQCTITLAPPDGKNYQFHFCRPRQHYSIYDSSGGIRPGIQYGNPYELIIANNCRFSASTELFHFFAKPNSNNKCTEVEPPPHCCCTEREKGAVSTRYNCTQSTSRINGSLCGEGEKVFPLPLSGSCEGLVDSGKQNAGDQTVGLDKDKLLSDARDLNQLGRFTEATPRDTIRTFIGQIIRVLTAFMGSILLVLYIYAGALWMTAAGNSEQADKAKQIFVWATLGIVVVLASYIIADFLFNTSGLIR